jgi:outer membrane protein assembly factor BamB
VFKVEASTGNIVWQTDPTTIGFGRFSYSGVVVDEQNGRLYTTGTPSSTPYNQSIVAALNINTGAIIWVKTASDLGLSGRNLGTGNLLLHPNRTRLYVRDDNNPDRIVALDASNGNRIWTYNMPINFDSDSWMLHRTLGPIWTDPVSERVRIAFVNNSTTVFLVKWISPTARVPRSGRIVGGFPNSLANPVTFTGSFWLYTSRTPTGVGQNNTQRRLERCAD